MSLQDGGFDTNVAFSERDLELLVAMCEEWLVSHNAQTEDFDRVSDLRERVREQQSKVRRRVRRREKAGRT